MFFFNGEHDAIDDFENNIFLFSFWIAFPALLFILLYDKQLKKHVFSIINNPFLFQIAPAKLVSDVEVMFSNEHKII